MFSIGDKVLHPVHGAGVIDSVEIKDFMGQEKQYYILNIPTCNMTVMVPCDNVTDSGIRPIIGKQEIDKVLQVLSGDVVPYDGVAGKANEKWNYRYRFLMEKIKGGNIFELAEIVRSLSIRNSIKPLSGGEKRLLDQAKSILVSELVLVSDSSSERVINQIDDQILLHHEQ